ncbi:hypothetical protein VTP01DRAFT_7475 [Rhizomucor pusillus]|uniref:uncharacterized protein n=1 Tax=Rhizomucor pusillus TaxID=4840 RepID=UPI003742DB3B
MLQELLWANKTVIAASSAAIIGVAAGYPFDSVKTRMQTEPYKSIAACVRHTYQEEGVRGFFRGMLPPIVTVSIIKSISFSVYEESKSFCKARFEYVRRQQLGSVMTLSTTAGAVSGAFIAAFSCPFELVKIHKQLEVLLLQASSITAGVTVVRAMPERDRVNRTVGAGLPLSATVRVSNNSCNSCNNNNNNNSGNSKNNGLCKKMNGRYASTCVQPTSSWHSAKEIIRAKGILGLWSGFGLHLLRDTVGTGVYFGGYETTKFLLTSEERPAGPMTQFLAGGICGILCWLAVFPIDLVKSLLQKDVLAPCPRYPDAATCIHDIYKTRGFTGFYRGVTVTLMRAFPMHSLNFLVYEQTLVLVRYLSNHTQEPVSL